MYETITKTTLGAGESVTATIGAGHLNKLFISTDIGSPMTISVRLRTDRGTRVLCQDVPLNVLKCMVDIQNGGARRIGYQMLQSNLLAQLDLSTLAAALATPMDPADLLSITSAGAPNISDYYGYQSDIDGGLMLDVGSIYLSKGDELAVTVRSAHASQDWPITIMSVSLNQDPYHLINYELIQDSNVTLFDSIAVYGFLEGYTVDDVDSNGVTRQILDTCPDVQVKSGDYSYIANYADVFVAQNTMLVTPANIREAFVTLWQNGTAIPESVDIRATGSGSDVIQFLNVSKTFIQSKTTSSNVDVLEELRARLERLERTEPEKAKALRHAGEIPKASEVAATVAVMETGKESSK